MFNLQLKQYRILAQIVFWGFYALLVFLIGLNFTTLFKLGIFLGFSLVVSALVVYPNYIYLLPILIKEKKTVKYLIWAFGLILVVSTISNYFQDLMIHDIDPRPGWQSIILRPVSLIILVGISSTWKFLEDWIRDRERDRERLENELKFLKNQINPHFLFNSLNNIYSLSYRNHPNAPKMIALLSEIMRYMLYDCGTKRVKLHKEVKLIENYIALQNLSQMENMNIDFYHEGVLNTHEIAPMLLINFVENAFKHSHILEDPKAWINIELTLDNNMLQFSVENNQSNTLPFSTEGGIGTKNTLRQLDLNYPGQHEINFNKNDKTYLISLKIKLKN